jgi:inorganic triphosphatase YgiF
MKLHPQPAQAQEIELKLWLPTTDPSGLVKRLAKTAVLARRTPVRQTLHNIYFDTPEQQLRQQRVALRLRRVGDAAKPQWLQTLKTSTNDLSALTQRGEWENPVAGAKLSRRALEGTPWTVIDPDGHLFESLQPCFVTVFERTLWLVRRRDGSVVEVALDRGHIEANGKTTPICELELELKAGHPKAVFEVAQQIAQTVAVLPANQSKAERGFLLAQDALDSPRHAHTPSLVSDASWPVLAQHILREMFAQLTTNLGALQTSDDPELVHQARVGWRRFKSGVRLFKKLAKVSTLPSWLELNPLLTGLGEVRNLDVARTETLPPLCSAFVMGDTQRAQSWQVLSLALIHAADAQRKAIRVALQDPVVGMSLLATSQWLENLSGVHGSELEPKGSLAQWAKRRVTRLTQQMEMAHQAANTPESFHRARILAKRLRYSTEALHELLPKRLTKQCLEQASSLQSSIGATRDMTQASTLVGKLNAELAIVEFLRGVAVGAELSAGLMKPSRPGTF